MDRRPLAESFRETNQSLLELLDFLSALHELSRLDATETDRATLIEGALKGLTDNQDLERCSVFLLQDEQWLVNVAGCDWRDLMGITQDKKPRGHLFPLSEGLMGAAVTQAEMQYCADCTTDPRFVYLPGARLSNIGSLICLPIQQGKEVLGVLNVSHPEKHHFGEAQLRMLRLFSKFLAQLLSNWQYLHQMECLVQSRTQELERALEKAKELQQKYETLSVVDDLTGLHNRRFFFPEAQAALSRAMRHQQPFSLIIFDLDHFKQINDIYGHAAGDRVLKDLAVKVSDQIRVGDILARFGGEEFVLAMPNTDLPGALILAKRLRQALQELSWTFSHDIITVTASIGLSALSARVPEGIVLSLDYILSEADQALYYSKHAGRDCITIFDDIAEFLIAEHP